MILSGCSTETNPASNVTASSATLNGTVTWTDGEGPGEYWWEYSNDNGGAWTATSHTAFGTLGCSDPSGTCSTQVTQDITALVPSSHYIFRLAGWTTVNGQQTPTAYGDSNWNSDSDPDPPYEYDSFDTPSGFLARNGTQLLLNGQPYKFTGLDIFQANTTFNNCSPNNWGTGTALDTALADIDAGSGGRAKMFRAWFFQSLATLHGQRTWAPFDHTLSVAAAHGYQVVPVLANETGGCENGSFKNESWYQTGYTQPDPAGIESYRDWVQEVVTRYASNPTIAWWDLINEPEDRTTYPNGSCPKSAAQSLQRFAADVAALAKNIDPNHLISLGTSGMAGSCGTNMREYQTLFSNPNLDICDYHDYFAETTALPRNLQTHLSQCNAVGKAFVVGESGINPCTIGGTLADRASYFDQKMSAMFAAGIRGFMPWNYVDPPASCAYDIGRGDPTLTALGAHGMAPP